MKLQKLVKMMISAGVKSNLKQLEKKDLVATFYKLL